MKSLEHGQDRLQKICEELKKSTLAPAKKEADSMINEAHARAQEIIKDAEKEAEKLIEATRKSLEQEKNVFQSSLSQGIKQGLEALRQEIEYKLFNDQLSEVVKKATKDPEVVAKLIDCLIKGIEKEGLSVDLLALVPKHIKEDEVNALLGAEILDKLKEHSVQIGDFLGGAKVKLNQKGLTLDMSDQAIQELLARYIRKDFRKLIFAT